MSIFFDFEVGSAGKRFRRAVAEDVNDIKLFLDHAHAAQLFGEVDIGALIELSVLPICMINAKKEVVGFMALNDFPNVSGLDPADWEMWMRNIFQKFYLARNTLFIHFMCCMDSVLESFLEEACISVFRNDVYLKYIILMSACEQEHVARYQTFKKKFMYRFNARRFDDSETSPHVIHVALRQDYCPKLKIRRAVEEDNDDIVELLDRKCPRLKELYGSYYISEIIGRHPESTRRIIVPEYQEHAVGVMCLNTEINYSHLQRVYELHPYHGLMKATPLEKEQMKRSNVLLDTFGVPIMLGQCGPYDFPMHPLEKNSVDDVTHIAKQKDKTLQKTESQQRSNKVNFKHRKRTRIVDSSKNASKTEINRKDNVSPTLSQLSYRSIETLILDEDPFDYEIVNIDKSLLSLAEAFSCEFLLGNKSTQSSIQSVASTCASVCKTRKKKSVTSIKRDRKDSIVPLLNGLPNAFLIELFELRDDVDDINSVDMLEAAFEIMKDFDYCVIHVPASERPLHLLRHFTFVPVRQKRCSEFSLYIAHRSSVLDKLRVRRAEVIDIPSIATFLQNMEAAETISMIEHSFSTDNYEAFVFMSGLAIVGIGILEPPEQLHFIRAKYNVDPYHYHKYHLSSPGIKAGFATVKIILIYPVFEVHFRFFAREMMRLSGSSTLIWMTAYRSKLMAHKSNTLMSAMVPLKPRRFDIDYSKIPELAKVAAVAKGMLPFSTWFLDKKLTSVPVVNVSTRILIVGASRTSLAFLDALLFGKASTYLRFNNVTLISTHGLPYTRHTSAAVEMMFPKHYSTAEKYLKCIPYTYYVNTITGTMIEINKQEKYVTLTSGHKVFYDMLFLFLGKQYQHPEYLLPIVELSMKCTATSPYRRVDAPRQHVEPDYICYDTPENVFIINSLQEARGSLKYVRHLLTEGFDFRVAVYGATIHAYCCLTALLEMNVPPESIVFIDPFPPQSKSKPRVSVFSNSNVDETIGEVLSSLGVEVHRSYYFQSWCVQDELVSSVQFLSQHQLISVECNAFYYYGKRGVNTQAFLAINKSGMAYNGGILIDHQCRTKEPSIYAAGPCTAYNSRYFAASKRHKYYDSAEIGAKLGEQIRNQLDPLFFNNAERKVSVQFCKDNYARHKCGAKTEDEDGIDAKCAVLSSALNKEAVKPCDMLPHFVKPRVRYCRLPGGLQYLEVRSPGKKIPHHYVQSLHYRGVIMETFKTGYFKLHLSNGLLVDGITCLTYEKHGLENYRTLYGRSSVVLNNVYLRYTTKKIDNFYEFFRSPWACFLYHDQTDELFDMVKELLPKGGNNAGSTLAEALDTVIELIIDKRENRVRMRKTFEPSPYIESVTEYVMDWLSQNDTLLPMYLHPSDRAEFIHDMERNLLLQNRRVSISDMLKQIIMKQRNNSA